MLGYLGSLLSLVFEVFLELDFVDMFGRHEGSIGILKLSMEFYRYFVS